MNLEYALTRREMSAFNKVVGRRISAAAKANRKLFVVNVVAWIPFGIAGASYITLYKKYPIITSELNTIVIAAALAAALIWVSAIYKRRLFQAVLRDDEDTRSLQSVSIDATGLSVVAGEASSRCTWSSVKDYVEDEVAVYLFMDLSHAIIIPKQAFGSAEELGQCREWARSSNNSLESDAPKATRASG